MRDNFKRVKNWSQYKKFRYKTRDLICKAKQKHFSESISSQTLWIHFRSLTNKGNSPQNAFPEEVKVNGETYKDSEDIAFKLYEYFASACDQFKTTNDPSDTLNLSKLEDYARSKIPSHIYITVPYITIQQVCEFRHALDPTKVTKAADILVSSIASLINKSIETATFASHLKVAKVFPIHKNGTKSDPSNYRPISILPTISNLSEKHINKHLMVFLNKDSLLHEN